MSQESTENIEKENINEENVSENQGIPTPDLSVEEQLQEELSNEKDKFLRLFAEFENYKRRTAKERIDLFKTANQEVLQAMLPVLDDFDRAWTQVSKSDDEALVTGVQLIHDKLRSTLVSKGLEEVEVRARVKGILVEKYFNEGEFVKKGTLLYKIEQDTYLANLNVAKASVKTAQANYKKAQKKET